MRRVLIIGIGAGDPDYLTVQAINALNQAHVFFIPDKGVEKEDLRRLRNEICRRFISHQRFRTVEFEVLPRSRTESGYRADVEAWHRRIAEQYAGMLQRELADDEIGAFLVWGDPSLYDSTLRILEAIRARGEVALDYRVIPGISSVQALAARHRIALNRIGEPIHVTTGRRLDEGLPEPVDNVVVMLDGDQAFLRLGRDDLEIFWGAYLGTEDEILVSGRLRDVMDDIQRIRAQARREKGWIMDTYLLRKRAE